MNSCILSCIPVGCTDGVTVWALQSLRLSSPLTFLQDGCLENASFLLTRTKKADIKMKRIPIESHNLNVQFTNTFRQDTENFPACLFARHRFRFDNTITFHENRENRNPFHFERGVILSGMQTRFSSPST
jgi:hypothetical protein